MAIIGEIIKRVIDVSGLIDFGSDPTTSQRKVLLQLIDSAKNTAFGKKYNFEDILLSDNIIDRFQKEVPFHDYDKMFKEWWHYLLEGHQNVTWPGGQRYFALSSGTTSHSKYIPVTDDMLDAIRKSGMQQIMSLKNFELPGEFFEKQILMLGSSTKLQEKNNHLEGEISGISAANIPSWFKRYYKPGSKIAALHNWDDKVRKIAKEAPKWDIGSITGIPSWTELMLKEVVRYNKLDTIHDIWPNLEVYTSGGVAFDPYRKSFDKLLARPIIYIDTYLASEGYLATQKRPDTSFMELIVDNGMFFEFVPFTDENIDENGAVKQGVQALTLADVKENTNYILLISTVAGAWRYMIGDTVMVTDKEKAAIKITGRTKHYLNVVGEQLSIHQMNAAIAAIAKKYHLEIKEFTVSAFVKGEEYLNKWFIGSDKIIDEIDELTQYLDQYLRSHNKNYDVARTKALKNIEVELIPIEHFYKWSAATKKLGGQVKIPRVLKEDDFIDFEQFIRKIS
ncbi:GH3 auxin-responsive promoter family protein [Olivibacter sp. SDN3]|uniref:GH3 family domain-containing protein n=1 Tax=Olivibacter sp. SDN3 TaxID=2764720 RepID=UPI001650FDF0|nr:GH3 auxin-responsive promoter family protein [Olivibacter sp. SDN3]QNL49018.1 GH3 auxin-responsive promoter family protein [Olivibacter sp. SDN3]